MYGFMHDFQEDDPTLMGSDSLKYGPSVCDIIGNSNARTPDFIELKNCHQREFLVILSDNLQKNHNGSALMGGSNYYGQGVTTFSGFTLKRPPGDLIPVVFHMKRDSRNHWRYPSTRGEGIASLDVGKIEGEVYGVSLRHLTHLDIVKRNGEMVKRKMVNIELLAPINKRIYTKAFQYEANTEFLDEQGMDPAYWRSCYGETKGGITHLSY
jgi:hypothetical protein